MTEKAYKKGSSAPPPPMEGRMRLYSMRFCPFAKRTRLVLAHKNIDFEIINLNLEQKPEWYLEQHPHGKVPVLEIGDRSLTESDIISEYLDDAFPDNRLVPTDPFEKAKHKIIFSKFGKIPGFTYQVFYNRSHNVEEIIKEVEPTFLELEAELKDRNSNFFGGEQVSLLDFLIWPWFEIIATMKGVYDSIELDTVVPRDKCPTLRAWVDRMLTVPAVKKLYEPANQTAFMKGMKEQNRDYDVGL